MPALSSLALPSQLASQLLSQLPSQLPSQLELGQSEPDLTKCHACAHEWPEPRGIKRKRSQTLVTVDGDLLEHQTLQGYPPVSISHVPAEKDQQVQCNKYISSSSLDELIIQLQRTKGSTHKRVLHLFAGQVNRPGSLGAAVRALGHECVEIDTINGPWHNLLGAELRNAVLLSVKGGEWDAVFMGTPCNTFSVARMNDGGAPQLRSTARSIGRSELSPHTKCSR